MSVKTVGQDRPGWSSAELVRMKTIQEQSRDLRHVTRAEAAQATSRMVSGLQVFEHNIKVRQAERDKNKRETEHLIRLQVKDETKALQDAVSRLNEAKENLQKAELKIEDWNKQRPKNASGVREWATEKAILDAEHDAYEGIVSDCQQDVENAQYTLERQALIVHQGMIDAAASKYRQEIDAANAEILEKEKELDALREKWQEKVNAKYEQVVKLGGTMDNYGRILVPNSGLPV